MKFTLDDKHLKAIEKGKSFVLPASNMNEGEYYTEHGPLLKKLYKAMAAGRGCTIKPDEHEYIIGEVEGGSILHSIRKIGRKMGMSRGDMAQVGNFFRPILNNASQDLKSATLRAQAMANNQMVGAMDKTDSKTSGYTKQRVNTKSMPEASNPAQDDEPENNPYLTGGSFRMHGDGLKHKANHSMGAPVYDEKPTSYSGGSINFCPCCGNKLK